MKNKGFTLVEMIGVIILLCAVALIVYPQIIKITKNQKEKLYQDQIETIKKSALPYVDSGDMQNDMYVKISDLKTKGYLNSKDIIDPRDDSVMDGCIHFVWDNSINQYKTDYVACP